MKRLESRASDFLAERPPGILFHMRNTEIERKVFMEIERAAYATPRVGTFGGVEHRGRLEHEIAGPDGESTSGFPIVIGGTEEEFLAALRRAKDLRNASKGPTEDTD